MATQKTDIRLPLDLLLILDVEILEEGLSSKYAVEYENEITFCKDQDDLDETICDMDNPNYYPIDEIELDRIQAIIELLNRAENDNILGHILDRVVR